MHAWALNESDFRFDKNENDFLRDGACAMPVHSFVLGTNRDVLSGGNRNVRKVRK